MFFLSQHVSDRLFHESRQQCTFFVGARAQVPHGDALSNSARKSSVGTFVSFHSAGAPSQLYDAPPHDA